MATRFVPLSNLDPAFSLFGSRPWTTRLDRQIPMDAYQKDNDLVLQFDLPGVAPESVTLEVESRMLTIRAERAYAPEGSGHVIAAERPWGQLSRQIQLGASLDPGRATASFEHGVLTVTVPVAEDAKSRRIEITHAPVSADRAEISAEATDTTGS